MTLNVLKSQVSADGGTTGSGVSPKPLGVQGPGQRPPGTHWAKTVLSHLQGHRGPSETHCTDAEMLREVKRPGFVAPRRRIIQTTMCVHPVGARFPEETQSWPDPGKR